jgi:hypothetical protein
MQDETLEILEINYKERKHWQHVPVKVPVLSMYLNIKANDNYRSPEGCVQVPILILLRATQELPALAYLLQQQDCAPTVLRPRFIDRLK